MGEQSECDLWDEIDFKNMLMLRQLTHSNIINIKVMLEIEVSQNRSSSRPNATITEWFKQRKIVPIVSQTLPDLNYLPPEEPAPYQQDNVESFTLHDHHFHQIPPRQSQSGALQLPSVTSCRNIQTQSNMSTISNTQHYGNERSPFSRVSLLMNTPSNTDENCRDKLQNEKASKDNKRRVEIARGEFFSGATLDFPMYDIAPEQEPVVLRSSNWIHYIKKVGQEFKGGVNEFRHKLVMYAAKCGFRFKYVRNDSIYVHAVCVRKDEEHCGWFIKGALSSVTQSVVIRTAALNHTCTLSITGNDVKRIGRRLIGNLISDVVRAKPTVTATDIKLELLTYYGFTVPYEKVWRSVEVARSNIFGGYADSFDELRWYSEALRRTNPGSEVFIETNPCDNRFQIFFLAFNASLQGFKKCRPMLFVDGTFMKTKYKGTLLAATAKDGNHGLFPVAIAIVDGENSANWAWFIRKIKDLVHHPNEIMFVSDRAGGLKAAIDDVYEKPLHFFCLYHLMQNLRSMYKGKKYSDIYKSSMCKLLREAAYAPNKHFYELAIHKFKLRGGPEADHFLRDLPPEKWAISFAPEVHRYGELTSNAAESFNSWILDARALPITFMIDCIRMKMMKWFSERRDEAQKWTGALTQRAEELWNQYDSLGDGWNINITNECGVYEVLCPTSTIVNLNHKTCSCYQWQIRGFPCSHAIAVIKRSGWHIRQLVDSCFFTDTYKEIYAENIYAIPSTEKWEIAITNPADKIVPPVIRRQPGRPRAKRFKVDSEGKKQRQFICGRCGEYGTHIWTTCKEALYDEI